MTLTIKRPLGERLGHTEPHQGGRGKKEEGKREEEGGKKGKRKNKKATNIIKNNTKNLFK